MRHGQFARHAEVAALTCAVSVAFSTLVFAQAQRKPRDETRSSASSPTVATRERVSGVILKVETVKKGANSGSATEKDSHSGKKHQATHRLTINTNAVWRDWARDQAQKRDEGTPKKDSDSGKNSVATKGEPVDENSLVVVDIGHQTHVETRFRSADDETSKGTTQPEDASDTKNAGLNRAKNTKPVKFHIRDLKPGLFVEADFRHVEARNPVSRITVIRPIGGPDSSAKAGSISPVK
ncbi:MAG: hypothetical protein NVSMB9_32570 [Isosphaeraceae bacterium]